MLEKIKRLGLRWKFGGVIFVALFLVVIILLSFLRSSLSREFETLYGDPSTKGLFIAKFLADELKPIIERDVDSLDIQQTVTTYKAHYGSIYGISYLFVLDPQSRVMADTFNDRVPQKLIEINPLAEERQCTSFSDTSGKKYFDCMLSFQATSSATGEKTTFAVRIGLLVPAPQSPIWHTFKTAHVQAVFNPLLLIGLVLIIIITGLLTLAFWYLVVRRVVALSEATERMSFGDLETTVPVQTPDEIGTLEDTLERMRANLKDAIERLKRRK
jgi:HAMP domain-containing protein